MNRRDFLKIVGATGCIVIAPSIAISKRAGEYDKIEILSSIPIDHVDISAPCQIRCLNGWLWNITYNYPNGSDYATATRWNPFWLTGDYIEEQTGIKCLYGIGIRLEKENHLIIVSGEDTGNAYIVGHYSKLLKIKQFPDKILKELEGAKNGIV